MLGVKLIGVHDARACGGSLAFWGCFGVKALGK